jgi:phenylpropionate dioxygenase-like ring-hydroxylating dioxygenase large terminal subunit
MNQTWMIAAQTEEVRTQPVARIVDGVALVLYRDSTGAIVALEDRCPHKNVALSLGRVQGSTLQCRYHGWRFDGAGCVVDVPCRSPDEKLPNCRVPRFRAVERDGWIWVNLADPDSVITEPPSYPRLPDHRWFELQYVVDGPVDLILENGLDCSHTGFAHEGLFRGAPKQFVTARIEETPTGVRAETLGEDTAGAKDTRSLFGAGRNQKMRHIDEVVLPHTLLVDYWIGAAAHVATILVCTPEGNGRTRVYNRTGVRYGWLTRLIALYMRWLVPRVVAQDVAILNSQAERIRRFGERDFRAVSADLAASWMHRAYRQLETGHDADAPLKRRDVVYKL